MNTMLILTILIVIAALAFDFINGFHDTANAIATAVSTKALRPKTAIMLAAFMNLLGAITFTGVAKTISKGIVDPFTLQNGSVVILAALISAIFWNLLTWYYGIPSSSSHALIGSIAGSAIASAGFDVIHWEGFIKIIEALLISPVIALTVGFLMMGLFKLIFKDFGLVKMNNRFRITQIFTAALQAFTHGTNDAQKSMGIITMALIAANLQTGSEVAEWVRFSCAIAMGLGTSIGGWKIIKTVGSKIMKIRPVNGVAADLSSALIIFGFTWLELPVSTTHVISSSIMGVGASHRMKGVKWGTAKRIIMTWVITMPISAVVAAIVFKVLALFFS